jgi:hypothetical protein
VKHNASFIFVTSYFSQLGINIQTDYRLDYSHKHGKLTRFPHDNL